MAETAIRAFGRYLKALRDRRGLSLNEVCSRSEPFAERISKGYLSRCENGHQRLALTKVIPLTRIYEVSADALVERMELDLELDRVGGPVTEGKSYSQLYESGKRAINEGFAWQAYAFCRDAVSLASVDLLPAYRDITEQQLMATQNCATAAMLAGRSRYALHELSHIQRSNGLAPQRIPLLLERLSSCYRRLDKIHVAREYADAAIHGAETSGESEWLGFVYTNRALVDVSSGDQESAAVHFQKAYEAHKELGREYETARALHNLSQVYVSLGRIRAARRVLESAEVRLRALNQNKTLALSRILLGEIESLEGHPERAVELWREAADLAKAIDDKTLRFQAEFQILKNAVATSNSTAVRTLVRRLQRLESWVAADSSDLEAFRALTARLKVSAG